ncbi:MAG: hypothetical protein K2K91_00870 [Ruminococcus sp.]|nr:hypothetical protein [Ruminococcus sp.]
MKNQSNLKKVMYTVSFVSALLTVILFVINNFVNSEIMLALAVTSLTVAYHFCIRLIIGNIIPLFKAKINTENRYFQVSETEKNIYKKLNIKSWKSGVPTYNPDEFDIKKNSVEQLIINCCNSEIVHTANIFASYIPILFSIWFNSLPVFIITSVLASIYDLQFVALQRYNRPRLLKIAEKRNKL